MSTTFSPGQYLGRLKRQKLGETKTGKPQIVLSFDILGPVDETTEAGYVPYDETYERTVFRVITEKTVEYVEKDLEFLGVELSSWSEIDEDNDPCADIRGHDYKLRCKVEQYNDKDVERWELALIAGQLEVKPLEAKAVRQLDAMFGSALKKKKSSGKPAGKPAADPVATPVATGTGKDTDGEI